MKENSLDEQNLEIPNDNLRPSDLMRSWRPYLFSDSEKIEEIILPEATFEYHLDTLTSRKQEYDFEHFARKLAEKELCPNLVPQTGPTGGGDGKVDTETYPVAEEISSLWYQGISDLSGKERWAFAFSAKKQWKGKVKSDVENIVNTNRNYKLIYFITNQFIKASTRTQVEEELTKEHSIQVRILDRSWLKKSVFENDRIELAIETLQISGFESKLQRKKGGRDTAREEELQQLEKQVNDTNRYEGVRYQLVEDCLEIALLARGLERPRTEIDGLFARAERIANQVNVSQQQLRVIYNKAWTVFWWYDDFDELNSLYDEVEKLALQSGQMPELEKLYNLWTLLVPTVARGQLDKEKAKIKKRTETLRTGLKKLADDETRPSSSLRAKTELVLMEFFNHRGNPELQSKLFSELKLILKEVEGLTSYPLETITRIITEIMGEVISDNEEFDDLFELVVDIKQRRTSEAEVGKTLLKRGYQKLRGNKNYDAIKLLGRSQLHLAKRENRPEFAEAIAGCGFAYWSVGLLWAARANFIAAANQAMSEFTEDGDIIPATLAYLRKIVWIELQLGRVPCILQWLDSANVIAGYVLFDDEEGKKNFLEEIKSIDLILAIFFLKTDFWELKWLYFLPTVLEIQGLNHSWMALLYALGYEEYLRKENVIPNTESNESVKKYFNDWLNQPTNLQLPEQGEFHRKQKITLKSVILGCEISVETPNKLETLYFAETLLGALEAFLATCIDKHVIPHRSDFKIKIVPSEIIGGTLDYQMIEIDDEFVLEIKCSSNIFGKTKDERAVFNDWLRNFILEIGLKILIVGDIHLFVEELIKDELGFGRALSFAEVEIPIENILGKSPKFKLSDWKPKDLAEKFSLKINSPWNYGVRIDNNKKIEVKISEPKYGTGESPEDLFDFEKLKHTDIKSKSVIDIELWDKAEWAGTLYIVSSDLNEIPILGMGFKNIDAANTIFRNWRKKLGNADENDEIRISIITGVNKNFPSHYRVLISSNTKTLKDDSKNRYFTLISRINYMEAANTENLDMFRRRYERLKMYKILPVHFVDINSEPKISWDLGITKKEIFFTPAWQIEKNDPDIVAIKEGDNPIIPNGVDASAILKRLEEVNKKAQF